MSVKTIEIHENVLGNNDRMADEIRCILKENKTLMINVMSSPGSGKTTLLAKLINKLKLKYNIKLMNVDIETDNDARRIDELCDIETLQINNCGLCHIDADMTFRAINNIDLKNVDLLILENIGNLVCPAEFDTGSNLNMMLLSIPEGDDKPLKYPLMFSKCDLVLFNKIDTLDFFDFDIDKCKSYVEKLNKNAKVIPISAKTEENMDLLEEYLVEKIEDVKNGN